MNFMDCHRFIALANDVILCPKKKDATTPARKSVISESETGHKRDKKMSERKPITKCQAENALT